MIDRQDRNSVTKVYILMSNICKEYCGNIPSFEEYGKMPSSLVRKAAILVLYVQNVYH